MKRLCHLNRIANTYFTIKHYITTTKIARTGKMLYQILVARAIKYQMCRRMSKQKKIISSNSTLREEWLTLIYEFKQKNNTIHGRYRYS